jgi:hypothetical protein
MTAAEWVALNQAMDRLANAFSDELLSFRGRRSFG